MWHTYLTSRDHPLAFRNLTRRPEYGTRPKQESSACGERCLLALAPWGGRGGRKSRKQFKATFWPQSTPAKVTRTPRWRRRPATTTSSSWCSGRRSRTPAPSLRRTSSASLAGGAHGSKTRRQDQERRLRLTCAHPVVFCTPQTHRTAN